MHDELIARLEAATADQQRELLLEAFELLNPEPDDGPAWGEWYERKRRFRKMLNAEAYESAALTLVPEGMAWVVYSNGPTYSASAEIGAHPSGGAMMQSIGEGEAATPALAICIAALKARGA